MARPRSASSSATFLPIAREGDGEVDRDGRLAHAPLAAGDGDDARVARRLCVGGLAPFGAGDRLFELAVHFVDREATLMHEILDANQDFDVVGVEFA